MEHIYLDNNATTRPAPEVVDAMLPWLRDRYGNPSSTHAVGQAARHAIENARDRVAALIGAKAREIVFTSGGTEADNLAILGTLAARPTRRHIVTTAVEHEAVLHLCRRLEGQGYRVTWLGVDTLGRLDPDEFAAALTDDTALASVMHANNETGVIFPVERLAAIAQERGVPLHVDAVQTAGKLPLNVADWPVSLLTISAHKLHGPKGVGAIYLRRGVRLQSQHVGGHQERDLRPGTENVPGIIGFGVAADLARRALESDEATKRRSDEGEPRSCENPFSDDPNRESLPAREPSNSADSRSGVFARQDTHRTDDGRSPQSAIHNPKSADSVLRPPSSVLDRIRILRDRLESGILERVPFAHVNGDREHRTSNTTNIGFETLEAEAVVITLSEHGICASAGAACSSGSLEPSHVLTAMRIDPKIAHGGVRFSLSRYTTPAEIDEALRRIPPLMIRLRQLLPGVDGGKG